MKARVCPHTDVIIPVMRGKKSFRFHQNVSPSPTARLNPSVHFVSKCVSLVHVKHRWRFSPSAFKIRDERGEDSHLQRATRCRQCEDQSREKIARDAVLL